MKIMVIPVVKNSCVQGFNYFLQIRVVFGASEGKKKNQEIFFLDQNLNSSLKMEYKIILELRFFLVFLCNKYKIAFKISLNEKHS